MSFRAVLFSWRFQEKEPSRIKTDSSPTISTGGFTTMASGWISSAVRYEVRRPTATLDSMTEVMTMGRTARGKVRRLKRAERRQR
jgi:hypothetical protein